MLGAVLVLLPGSMLLWPLVVVVMQRRKASRQNIVVPAPNAEAAGTQLANA